MGNLPAPVTLGCRCDPPGSGEEYCTGHCQLRAKCAELEQEVRTLFEVLAQNCERHSRDLSYAQFVEAGGLGCSQCLTADNKLLAAENAQLVKALEAATHIETISAAENRRLGRRAWWRT